MSGSSPVLIAAPTLTPAIMDPLQSSRLHHQHHTMMGGRGPTMTGRRKRKEVAVFVKVLLDYLHRSEPALKDRVKEVVAECILKNRDGDVNYSNLAHSIKSEAREVVGEWHWTRAKLIILYARQFSRKGRGSSKHHNQRQVVSRTA
jgi:hypothetical protein